MLSHTALVTQSLVHRVAAADIGPEYVYLNSGPLFHLATLMQTFATFVAGGTNVFTRRVDAEELCRLIDAERCTGAFLVGPTIKQMVEVNRDRRYDLTSLRSGGRRPEWLEMITRRHQPDGRATPAATARPRSPACSRSTRSATPTIGTHGRAVAGRAGADRRSRRRRGARRARPARSWPAARPS